jgi:hypothetical protein
MDNGLRFPYRIRIEPGDGEGKHQPENGCSGARKRGDEEWRKHSEPSSESESPRRQSGGSHASKKSPKFVKSNMPVPETDTGG